MKTLRKSVFGALRKTVNLVKANYFCFDEINSCADVSFQLILFRVVLLAVFNFYNRLSPEMKFLSK